jgi:hypothetical protein
MDLNRMNTVLRSQWDRALAVAFAVGGAIALLIGWLGISGTALSYKQLPYIISGGLFGVVLVGIGLTVYLSADLRDEWRKLDSLEDALNATLARLEPEEPIETSPLGISDGRPTRARTRAVKTTTQ